MRLGLLVLATLALAPTATALEVEVVVPGALGHEGLVLRVATDEEAPPAPDAPPPPAPSTGTPPEAPPLPLVPRPPPIVVDFAPLEDAVAALVAPPARGAPADAPASSEETTLERVYVGHAPAPVAPEGVPPEAALLAVATATAASGWLALAWERLRRLAPLVLLYTRIAKERLLDHTGRDRLLAVVRAQPGIPLADAARAAGLARNTAVYHLARLEREGLVSSQREGRVRLYFAPGALDRRERAEALVVLRHPTSARLAAEVGAAPGLDQRTLCERVGVRPSLAHWHASRLVGAGVVEARREGRRVRYYPGACFDLASPSQGRARGV